MSSHKEGAFLFATFYRRVCCFTYGSCFHTLTNEEGESPQEDFIHQTTTEYLNPIFMRHSGKVSEKCLCSPWRPKQLLIGFHKQFYSFKTNVFSSRLITMYLSDGFRVRFVRLSECRQCIRYENQIIWNFF